MNIVIFWNVTPCSLAVIFVFTSAGKAMMVNLHLRTLALIMLYRELD